MTKKEKAIELVYKYEYLVETWDCYNDEPLEMKYRILKMKQCALIAVDEIINVSLNSQNNENYWRQVKQEIVNL
tara:strand:+ start:260 stop:481 length:222 start_codon:yes stop_codon:yes gene_type:complete